MIIQLATLCCRQLGNEIAAMLPVQVAEASRWGSQFFRSNFALVGALSGDDANDVTFIAT
jgi:hypothetical protein